MALVIPLSLHALAIILGFLALSGLVLLVYVLVVGPARHALADTLSPPPEEESVEELLMEAGRIRQLSIGQVDSDLPTRMNGIREDHVLIKIRKDPDIESYTITISPGGPVFYRAPHQKNYELMSGPESFESSELIGYPALFRLTAHMRDNRPLQFIEYELSTKFYINNSGEERMKFLLKLNRIYPSIDLNSRSKRGVFNFGRLKRESDQEGEEEAA